jgi:hypothetical protein
VADSSSVIARIATPSPAGATTTCCDRYDPSPRRLPARAVRRKRSKLGRSLLKIVN